MRSVTKLITIAEAGHAYKTWYRSAHADLVGVCRSLAWDPSRVCDVVAITSSRVAVRRNVRVALHYMYTGELMHPTIRSTRLAMSHYEETGEIRGPKTSAFAEALKGDEEAMVLDVWMARCLQVDHRAVANKGTREEAYRRIVKAARELEWSPAETQAACWAMTMKQAGRNVPQLSLSSELELFDGGANRH